MIGRFKSSCNKLVLVIGWDEIENLVKLIEDSYNRSYISEVRYVDPVPFKQFNLSILWLIDKLFPNLQFKIIDFDNSKYLYLLLDHASLKCYQNYVIINIAKIDKQISIYLQQFLLALRQIKDDENANTNFKKLTIRSDDKLTFFPFLSLAETFLKSNVNELEISYFDRKLKVLSDKSLPAILLPKIYNCLNEMFYLYFLKS